MEGCFNNFVPVCFKYSDREERNQRVRLSVTVCQNTTSSHSKELVVRLTDDQDAFFLYTLILGEEDFQILKNQQSLLVDFGAFPKKFVNLLDLCLKEEHKEIPKFLLQFVVGGEHNRAVGHLNVVETNPFKHLTHLSLKFLPGSDADVKKYLAECLTSLKSEKARLEERLSSTESDLKEKLATCQQSLAMKSREADSLRAELSSRLSELSTRHTQELAAERENTLQSKNSSQQLLEVQKREMEKAHRTLVRQLESRLNEMEQTSKDLTEQKYTAESTVRELRTRLEATEKDQRLMKDKLLSLKQERTRQDSEQFERDKTLGHLKTRLAVLEQENQDKDKVIERTNALLKSTNDHKKRQEKELEVKDKQVTKLSGQVKHISAEVIKGNEIIQLLQSELRNLKSKVKLQSTATSKQEKLLAEKESIQEQQNKDITSLQKKLEGKEDEVKRLTESLESAVTKLDESKQLLKTNENVINWLNRQMNEKVAPQQPTKPFQLHPQALFRPSSDKCVTYSRSTTRTGSLPAPLSQSTPTIPEEPAVLLSKPFSSGSVITVDLNRGRDNEPVLDAKYLQRRETNAHSNEFDKLTAEQNTRRLPLKENAIPTRSTAQSRLMSAYFPK